MPEPRMIVVGGGITGLVAAYLAARDGRKVAVLEGGPRVGGLLETFATAGDPLECFYHHFFTHDSELRWLVGELGLADRLEFLPSSMGVLRGGRIYPFDRPADLLRFDALGWWDKARFGASSLYLSTLANWRHWEDTPALDWFERHAGAAATDALWRPLLEIKFGPYASRVPAAWIVGRLRQRVHSRERGQEKLGYLRGSLRVLVDALLERLRSAGVEVVTDARVQSLQFEAGALTGVETAAGPWSGDAFLFTLPTLHLAGLLERDHPAYAAGLRRIEYFGALCVVLELPAPLGEVYWLNVADAGYPFGGVIEHTRLVPSSRYGARTWVYLSRYFEAGHPLESQSETQILDSFLPALGRIYPRFARGDVQAAHVFRSRTAATVCDLGFSQRIPSWRSPVPNLFVASMCHVYPDERSCNNSIRIAAEACAAIGIDSSSVPRGSTLAGRATPAPSRR